MKKLSILTLNAAIVSGVLAGCGGGGGPALMPAPVSPVTAPQPTGSPGQSGPQQRTSATFTITVPKATAASASSRRAMYVSPNTASLRLTVLQVDGKTAKVPDTVVALNASTPGCTNATAGLSCVINASVPVGNNVTFQVSTYASTDGSGAVLSQDTLTNPIVANASNPIALTLGGIVASIAFSPGNLPVYADGAGHRYLIAVNAKDASGATIVGTERYQNPISLSIQGDPNGALGLSNVSLQGPGSTFYLTYNAAISLPGATISATDATMSGGTPVKAQLFMNPLSYSETTKYGTWGMTRGTPYTFTLHEQNFTGTFTATVSDPALETVSVTPPDTNGNSTVTLTPSSTNSGYAQLMVSDGTITMPIGTQVIVPAGTAGAPTITMANLPNANVDRHEPYRLLSGPSGSNTIWYAATSEGEIVNYNTATHSIVKVYTSGSTAGATPEFMQWSPLGDGKIWYADGNPNQPSIDSFDTATGNVVNYTTGFSSASFPYSIITDSNGKFWIGDQGPGAQAIAKFDPANPTAGVTEYTSGFIPTSRPISLTFGPDGNIWFADQVYGTGADLVGAVGMFDMSTHTSSRYQSTLPTGISDDEDGPSGIVSDGTKLWFGGWGGTGYIGSIDPVTKQIQLYYGGIQYGSRPLRLMLSKDHTKLWYLATSAYDPLRGLTYGIGMFDLTTKRATEYHYGIPSSATTQVPHELADLIYGPDGNVYFADEVYATPAIGEVVCPGGC